MSEHHPSPITHQLHQVQHTDRTTTKIKIKEKKNSSASSFPLFAHAHATYLPHIHLFVCPFVLRAIVDDPLLTTSEES
jgi:hypothetical protein